MTSALQALGDTGPFGDVSTRLRGIVAELDDVVADLRSLTEQIEEQPERLEQLRERRQLLVDLRRKYGSDLAEVMAFHAEADDRLRELEDYDRRAAELDGQRTAAAAAEREAAAVVGAARRAAAPRLAAAVEARLRELAMPNAAVAVDVGRSADDQPGDDVRFLLSANPGSPLLPLNRVASGGELARAMLALRLVLVNVGERPAATTLVFDEVDAGIGGSAAAAVGAALADLGEPPPGADRHPPAQVAAQATRQLVVAKSVHAGQTFTTVDEVDGDDRVAEIARMLAGSETEVARDHARDLLGR